MMQEMTGSMGWMMGATGFLVVILLLLGIAALLKYLLARNGK